MINELGHKFEYIDYNWYRCKLCSLQVYSAALSIAPLTHWKNHLFEFLQLQDRDNLIPLTYSCDEIIIKNIIE